MLDFDTLHRRAGGGEAINNLLFHFYADVRQHRVLGPLFDAHIDDWPAHLEKIAGFWSTMTGGPARYAGKMPLRHIPLGLTEFHFQSWLGLWEHQCRICLPAGAADEMIATAHRIAARLKEICGLSATGAATDAQPSPTHTQTT